MNGTDGLQEALDAVSTLMQGIAGIEAKLVDHEARIEVLEAAAGLDRPTMVNGAG